MVRWTLMLALAVGTGTASTAAAQEVGMAQADRVSGAWSAWPAGPAGEGLRMLDEVLQKDPWPPRDDPWRMDLNERLQALPLVAAAWPASGIHARDSGDDLTQLKADVAQLHANRMVFDGSTLTNHRDGRDERVEYVVDSVHGDKVVLRVGPAGKQVLFTLTFESADRAVLTLAGQKDAVALTRIPPK